MIIRSLLLLGCVHAEKITVRLKLCSDLHNQEKVALGAESKGNLYVGLDSVAEGADIKLNKLNKLKAQLGKRTNTVREIEFNYKGDLEEAKTAEVFFYDKKDDQLCLEMLELVGNDSGFTIRLIQDYELWAVAPDGWTSLTQAKVMLWDSDCPVGVRYCQKSKQYVLNVDPRNECALGMDVCDENATCYDKF